MRRGLLTDGQYKVLVCRGKGLTQRETAKELGTTRENVSMIELRARKNVLMARQTLEAYRSTLTDHVVRVPRGTRFSDIPSAVLREGDRWGVHLQSNIVDILRMVKGVQPSCLQAGRSTRIISFAFNSTGKVRIGSGTR